MPQSPIVTSHAHLWRGRKLKFFDAGSQMATAPIHQAGNKCKQCLHVKIPSLNILLPNFDPNLHFTRLLSLSSSSTLRDFSRHWFSRSSRLTRAPLFCHSSLSIVLWMDGAHFPKIISRGRCIITAAPLTSQRFWGRLLCG